MSIHFQDVVRSIVEVNRELTIQTVRAVNVRLTLRNFMIGYYIDAFQLQGADRAAYGDWLFTKLAVELRDAKLSNCEKRQLYYYLRLFHVTNSVIRPVLNSVTLPPGADFKVSFCSLDEFRTKEKASPFVGWLSLLFSWLGVNGFALAF